MTHCPQNPLPLARIHGETPPSYTEAVRSLACVSASSVASLCSQAADCLHKDTTTATGLPLNSRSQPSRGPSCSPLTVASLSRSSRSQFYTPVPKPLARPPSSFSAGSRISEKTHVISRAPRTAAPPLPPSTCLYWSALPCCLFRWMPWLCTQLRPNQHLHPKLKDETPAVRPCLSYQELFPLLSPPLSFRTCSVFTVSSSSFPRGLSNPFQPGLHQHHFSKTVLRSPVTSRCLNAVVRCWCPLAGLGSTSSWHTTAFPLGLPRCHVRGFPPAACWSPLHRPDL